MIVALVFAAVYLIFLGVAVRQRTGRRPAEIGLIAYAVFSVVLMGVHAVILGGYLTLPDPLPLRLLPLTGFAVSLLLVCILTLLYLELPARNITLFAVPMGIWAVAVAVVDVMGLPPLFGTPDWLVQVTGVPLSLSVQIASVGWLVFGLLAFFLTLRAFLAEPLPLYANRILFWTVVLPFLFFGDALTAWLTPPWYMLGYGLRMVGMIGAVYAVITHRVVDLREVFRFTFSRAILTITTALLIVAGIVVSLLLVVPGTPAAQQWIVVILDSLLVAVLIGPVSAGIRWLLRSMLQRGAADAAEVVRRYGQEVSGLIDLDELADVAVQSINDLLGTRRASLILATHTDSIVTLQRIGGKTAGNEVDDRPPGVLSTDGPIYKNFITQRSPLLQYDIDFHKSFVQAPETERAYFSSLSMDIYVPIFSEDNLVGLFAIGPKSNDDPFRSNEAELMGAFASQTAAALENARLVSDLRDLNTRISALNEDLRTSNERLEKLDGVKTDFITIASHELRTPLTQILGYADLLNRMAERGTLDPKEVIEITSSLSHSSDRMNEVIKSMMDVSRIDVQSMDLRFVETTIANVLKLAIDPYGEFIEQRKQVLVARGLSNLPPIQADYKRLVQAFQNLITNAIKFTPDGGKIDVIGQVYEKDDEGKPVSIRVSIQDSGIGLDPKHHELVFEKFYRVGPVALHSTGSTKFKGAGPGLGLSISKGIIEGHGGRVWVESSGEDEETFPGSTFHVVLPLRPPALEAQKHIEEMGAAEMPLGEAAPATTGEAASPPPQEEAPAAQPEEPAADSPSEE